MDQDKEMVLKSMCGPYGFFLIFILLNYIFQQTCKSKYKCMICIFDFVIFYKQNHCISITCYEDISNYIKTTPLCKNMEL